MKTYEIPVSWSVFGTMKIEAESLEEAIETANSTPLDLVNTDYLEDSFVVDIPLAEELNEEELSYES